VGVRFPDIRQGHEGEWFEGHGAGGSFEVLDLSHPIDWLRWQWYVHVRGAPSVAVPPIEVHESPPSPLPEPQGVPASPSLLAEEPTPAAEEPRTPEESRTEQPDGGKMAFVGTDGNVWTMSLDGSGQMRLTDDGGNCSPRWSPDGSQIAFLHEFYRDKDTPIYRLELMEGDGSNRRVVMMPPAAFDISLHPYAMLSNVRWSADGCTLYTHVALGPVGGHGHLIHAEPLCAGSPYDFDFAQAFDVREDGLFAMLFAGGGLPRSQLFIGRPEAGEVDVTIDVYEEDAETVAWSPDGTLLAIVGGDRIKIVTETASEVKTFPALGAENATWTPDGRSLIYDTENGIYRLSLDTGETTFVTKGTEPHCSQSGEGTQGGSG